MGHDLETRFWISTIELFVIMNSFTITEKIKISGFSNMEVTLRKFAKGHLI